VAWDLVINPVTKDLVRDGAGGWQRTETGETAVRNQVEIHYNRWPYDPAIGSLLFDRSRFASAPGPLVAAELRRALGLLATEQVIADVAATATESSAKPGRVDARTTYRLVETGQAVDLELPGALGG
jgi:hypothetical protein